MRNLNNETQLLLHCSFTKAWQNLQQDASKDYYILRVFVCSISYTKACKVHVLCHISHLWPVRLHIVPRCLRKQHDFRKNVIEHKMFV